jgi:Ca2+-binding RTX toxin-like protein
MVKFSLQRSLLAIGTFITFIILFSSTPVTSLYFSTVSVYAAPGIKCDSSSNPCVGTSGDDRMTGDNGVNIMRGGDGDDVMNGKGINDDIFGEEGNDKIDGGPGHDEIDAGSGDDIINGGSGPDFLEGREGADSFICGPGEDGVDDFHPEEGDTKTNDCEFF